MDYATRSGARNLAIAGGFALLSLLSIALMAWTERGREQVTVAR